MIDIRVIVAIGFFMTGCVEAATTAFTYQGRLLEARAPANGLFDFRFSLYDAGEGGKTVAEPLTNVAIAVVRGEFIASLDFGPDAFDGTDRWIEISVATNGANSFAILSPRQEVTPTPFSLYAAQAGAAATYTGTVSPSQLAGPIPPQLLPEGVLINNATNVNLSGAFTGDGSGLSGVRSVQSPPGYDIVSISTVTAAAGDVAFPGLVHKLAWTNSNSTNLQFEILRAGWEYSPSIPTAEGSIVPVEQTSYPNTMPMYVNFGFDGAYFIFGVQGKHCPVVIAINNTDWPTNVLVPFDSGYHYYKVQFASSAPRQITLKLAGSDAASHQFLGVWIDPASGWWGRSLGKKYRMIVLGSSYVEEPGPSSGLYPNTGYPSDLMYLFSNVETWASGSGGTGIVASNGVSRPNYLARIYPDVIRNRPDMLLIDAMANDDNSPSNSIYANAFSIFTTVQSNLPNCKIIVATSPFWGNPPDYSPSNASWKTYVAVTNAMNDAGVTNFIDTFADPVFPTGFNPAYEAAAHPTALGCWVYAEALAAKLGAICPELVPSGYAMPGLPLTVPTQFAATAGSNVVNLSWTAPVSGATGYIIKRSRISAGETLLTNVSSLSFADLAVTNGTTYYYTLSALNNGVQSPDTYEVQATPAIPPPQGLLSVRMTPIRYLAAYTNVFSDYAGTTFAVDGGHVRLWKDSTTNAYDLAARSDNQVLQASWSNSQPALRTTTDYFCLTNFPGSEPVIRQPVTFLLIGQFAAQSGRWWTGADGVNSNSLDVYTTGSPLAFKLEANGALDGQALDTATNGAAWFMFTFNGNNSTIYIDGTNAVGGYVSVGGNGIRGMAFGNTGTATPAGTLAEFVEYQGLPSTNDLNIISNYCAIRYGIHN